MEKDKSKKTSWLPSFLLFLLGLILGFSLFYFLESTSTTTFLKQDTASQSSESTTEETQETQNSPTPTITTFTGTYISGERPTGWSIVEYTDNSGSDMIMEQTTYSGLVGLKVFNENSVKMFHLNAVDGVGGVQGCDTVYQFSDSDQAYIDHGSDWTLQSGIVPSTVVDLTNATYTEYELLGWEVRRVGDTIYRNMNSNLPGFNPACGVDINFTISNLTYYRTLSGETTSGNIYYMEISDTVDQSQLEQLDDVLESLTVN